MCRKADDHRDRVCRGSCFQFFSAFSAGQPPVYAIRAWQARRHAQKVFALINKELYYRGACLK